MPNTQWLDSRIVQLWRTPPWQAIQQAIKNETDLMAEAATKKYLIKVFTDQVKHLPSSVDYDTVVEDEVG